jgi:putative tricarboxylic transport membrane protein
MNRSWRSVAIGLALAMLLAPVTGCAGTVAQAGDLSRIRIMAPASPGGGWDTTSRTMQQAMQRSGLVRNVQVFNVEGAGGVIGLGQLARETDDNLLMTMGLVMLGAIETNNQAVTLDEVTPIARLTGESEVIVVPADSPFETLEDFTTALAEDPGGNAIAGGSAGGTDHMLAGMVALAVGADPREINYVAYSGGGESLGALLGNQVAAGISGVGEYAELVKSGDLRALAVSGTERTDQLPDTPTLQEQGVDVELTNWRGIMAPPSISDEQRDDLIGLIEDMYDSEEWQEALTDNGWEDVFLVGDEFGAYIEEERTRVHEVLVEIGLVES